VQHVPEYLDRQEAGKCLADSVCQQDWDIDIVLALPKGGVPAAVPVAASLEVPLNLLIANKIRHPIYPEVAIGAVTGVLYGKLGSLFDDLDQWALNVYLVECE
jgi:predicted phosphoribosyltransferase